jgi:hypothetical protein
MSTELKTVKGTFECIDTLKTKDTKLKLMSFYGGKQLMLRMTIRAQGKYFTQISLNKEEIKTLIKELQTNFNL